MSLAKSFLESLSPAAVAMARALGALVDQSGTLRAATCARYCLEQAQRSSGEVAYAQWAQVAADLERMLRRAAETNTSIAHPPRSPARTIADRMARFPCAPSPTNAHLRVSSFLARALASSCVHGVEISATLIDGACTLVNVSSGKGRASKDWAQIPVDGLLDAQALSQAAERMSGASPAIGFVVAAVKALEPALVPPTVIPPRDGTHRSEGKAGPRNLHGHFAGTTQAARDKPQAPQGKMDTTPNIAGRFVIAESSGVAEKFGFPSRESLPLEELVVITRKLRGLLESGSLNERVFSTLALISLVTGCTDAWAINLRFEPRDSIWLHPDSAGWCWDFAEYRRSAGTGTESLPREPIVNAFPEVLARELVRLKQLFPAANTVGELLSSQLRAPVKLKHFREFLRSHEESPHPAYRGRFARSLGPAWLEITGSDMGAALATGNFAASGPAALFYFGPTEALQQHRAARVFERLRLGPPAHIPHTGARIGCRKVAEAHVLRTGWQRLSGDINSDLARVRSSNSEELEIVNRITRRLCAGFVLQTAHRGSRIDRLTFGALYLHPRAMTILDKDEGDRHPGRLLPKTRSVDQLLAAASECHRLVSSAPAKSLLDPVFVQWTRDSAGALTWRPITTGELAEVLRQYFGEVEFNFGRSTWITHLDEHGCDRWLIRVLSGHTRDVTRTNEPYFDVSPLEFASRLRKEMERVGAMLFGETAIDSCNIEVPAIVHRFRLLSKPELKTSFRVPDPRSALEDVDEETLAGWRVVHEVRMRLVGGDIEAHPGVLAFLSMLFLDFFPSSIACLDAIVSPQTLMRRNGCEAGVLWHRPHFKHATWIPIDATTERLIGLAQPLSLSRGQLARDVCRTLQRLDSVWPRKPSADCNEAERALRQFLRIECPPSLQALARPDVPAPALSALSLMRLADAEQTCKDAHTIAARRPPRRPDARSRALPDLEWLRESIHEYTLTVERVGEAQARAVALRAKIDAGFSSSSLFSQWIAEWVFHELDATASLTKDCLAISSIYTYLCVLITNSAEFDAEDPAEWADEDWLAWLDRLQPTRAKQPEASQDAAASGDPKDAHETNSTDAPLEPHVRHAVARLVRSLLVRDQFIAWEVRQRLFAGDAPRASGSASAAIILDDDIDAAVRIAQQWIGDSPLDQLILRARSTLHRSLPCRAGDISSLETRCLTPSGGLVIERKGYTLHKNNNTIRVTQLAPEVALEIRQICHELELSHPAGATFLLRGLGDRASSEREVYVLRLFAEALKLASGDASARPHSIRARVLQDIAWPGWLPLVRALLASGPALDKCTTWVSQADAQVARVTWACVQAGHGDLRSGFGHYLAAWPLILRIRAIAMRAQLQPATGFLEQLGVKANTRTRAALRSPQRNTWDWLGRHLLRKQVQARQQPPATASRSPEPGSDSTINGPDAPRAPESTTMRSTGVVAQPMANVNASIDAGPPIGRKLAYLAARIVGINKPRAMEFAQLGLRDANLLDRQIPSGDLIAMAVQRAREGPGARGAAANERLMLGEYSEFPGYGWRLVDWVANVEHRDLLHASVARVRELPPAGADFAELWKRLGNACPESVSLVVHRSPRHLPASERQATTMLDPAVLLKLDPNIGAWPVLKIVPRGSDNRVVSSRLTAVFRSIVVASAALCELVDHA